MLETATSRPPPPGRHLQAATFRPPPSGRHLQAATSRPPPSGRHLQAATSRPPPSGRHLQAATSRASKRPRQSRGLKGSDRRDQSRESLQALALLIGENGSSADIRERRPPTSSSSLGERSEERASSRLQASQQSSEGESFTGKPPQKEKPERLTRQGRGQGRTT